MLENFHDQEMGKKENYQALLSKLAWDVLSSNFQMGFSHESTFSMEWFPYFNISLFIDVAWYKHTIPMARRRCNMVGEYWKNSGLLEKKMVASRSNF